jgi:hypothetical protein
MLYVIKVCDLFGLLPSELKHDAEIGFNAFSFIAITFSYKK